MTNWEISSASAVESIVSMTDYGDAYKIHLPMQLPMAMAMEMAMAIAMVIMSSEQQPPSMPPSQDKVHTTIGDINKITGCNSDNDRHLVRVTSAILDVQMPDIPEVEIWGIVLLWMFLLSLLFS